MAAARPTPQRVGHTPCATDTRASAGAQPCECMSSAAAVTRNCHGPGSAGNDTAHARPTGSATLHRHPRRPRRPGSSRSSGCGGALASGVAVVVVAMCLALAAHTAAAAPAAPSSSSVASMPLGGADGAAADDTSAVASALTASKAAARALLRGVVAAVADTSVGVETASATSMQQAASVVGEAASATGAAARVLAVSAECEVPQQVSVTVPLPDEATDNVVMGGVAFVAVAVAVLARVALCRRAWGELPVYDQKVNGRWTTANGQAPRSNPVLAPNWRNRFVLGATLADGFMCAAPAFLPHVPWFSYLPLKLVARLVTMTGVWLLPVYMGVLAVAVAVVLVLALSILLNNYNVSVGSGVAAVWSSLTRTPSRSHTVPELLNVTTLGAMNSTALQSTPRAAVRAAYERTAVSARDPRDGGYWQPRGSLPLCSVLGIYLLSTLGLVPVLVSLAQFWTCAYPAGVMVGSDCASTSECWTAGHVLLCAASAVVLMVLLPIATIGYVSQQRLDAEAVAASVVTEPALLRRTDSDNSIHIVKALRSRHSSRATESVAAGSPRAAKETLGFAGRLQPVGGDGGGVEPSSGGTSSAATSTAGGESGGTGSSSTVFSMATVLHLQQRTSYVVVLVLVKVALAASAVFVARVNPDTAVVACAALNTALLCYVWAYGAFSTVKYDIVARVTHLTATALCWLLVVNSSFVATVPTLRLWGPVVSNRSQLIAENSDAAVAGHAVVAGSAAALVLILAVGVVLYRTTLKAQFGNAALFGGSNLIRRTTSAPNWDGSFFRRRLTPGGGGSSVGRNSSQVSLLRGSKAGAASDTSSDGARGSFGRPSSARRGGAPQMLLPPGVGGRGGGGDSDSEADALSVHSFDSALDASLTAGGSGGADTELRRATAAGREEPSLPNSPAASPPDTPSTVPLTPRQIRAQVLAQRFAERRPRRRRLSRSRSRYGSADAGDPATAHQLQRPASTTRLRARVAGPRSGRGAASRLESSSVPLGTRRDASYSSDDDDSVSSFSDGELTARRRDRGRALGAHGSVAALEAAAGGGDGDGDEAGYGSDEGVQRSSSQLPSPVLFRSAGHVPAARTSRTAGAGDKGRARRSRTRDSTRTAR